MSGFGIDAVVFDLDGTLVDTAPDLHALLNRMLDELGRPPLDLGAIRSMIGDGARALLERGLVRSGGLPEGQSLDSLFEIFLDRYSADPISLGRPFPGALDQLRRFAAAGLKQGVCTNKPQAPSERILMELEMSPYLGAVIGGDVLGVRKPDPGHLLAVLERLGVPPARAVLIGDSAADVATARGAGVPCVLVSFGYTSTPAIQLGAERVIDRFADLPEVLADMARSAA